MGGVSESPESVECTQRASKRQPFHSINRLDFFGDRDEPAPDLHLEGSEIFRSGRRLDLRSLHPTGLEKKKRGDRSQESGVRIAGLGEGAGEFSILSAGF